MPGTLYGILLLSNFNICCFLDMYEARDFFRGIKKEHMIYLVMVSSYYLKKKCGCAYLCSKWSKAT